MALIIEDGTISNPQANSYQTVAELREWAELRGVDITSLTEGECEVLLIKAMDYLESLKSKYKGRKTRVDQPLQFPRADVVDYHWVGHVMDEHEIPIELQQAQKTLALEAINTDLLPNTLPDSKGVIIREKVGPIELQYEPRTPKMIPAFAKVDHLLIDFLKNNGMSLVQPILKRS